MGKITEEVGARSVRGACLCLIMFLSCYIFVFGSGTLAAMIIFLIFGLPVRNLVFLFIVCLFSMISIRIYEKKEQKWEAWIAGLLKIG